jgi:hypothetical protein
MPRLNFRKVFPYTYDARAHSRPSRDVGKRFSGVQSERAPNSCLCARVRASLAPFFDFVSRRQARKAQTRKLRTSARLDRSASSGCMKGGGSPPISKPVPFAGEVSAHFLEKMDHPASSSGAAILAATSSATRRKPRSQPDILAVSRRTPGRRDASTGDLAGGINAVHLKDRLGDVETDCRDRLHNWLLRIVGALTAPTSMALTCQWRSRPQHQLRTSDH